ncbi:glycosyltransferase [Chryseotalea sanaruensis]|uniref:Glycosyltransferase n=1 Tax=Chryseotalea sanaruensis TaxID=2482724 RepID=A0A401UAI1_9BACT|nr:TIGR04282 family arsenosugar biosynthesis glycosyltransferase [Chryseotalea sanaruensis]GCC51913.1 glycosyltransferase [Chryseotalea sanaruensis]
MTVNSNLLLIFYRNPKLGKVKTRLASTLGNEKALSIYLKLAAHTLNITEGLKADKVVFYSDTVENQDHWLNEKFKKAPQAGKDLGERMLNAFQYGFDQGYNHICIIGTDCLELNTSIIESAFEALDQQDVVIGPAKDGGYYLLGMKKAHSDFFSNKNWSTQTVMHDTLLDTLHLKASVHLLPLLSDVDVEEDLKGQLL